MLARPAEPPLAASVLLRGVALHRGGSVSVRLSAAPGPIVIAQRGQEAPLRELRVVRADRGVTLATADDRIRLDLVEHLFAAVGGLGLREGLRIATDDGELPLLDGGARRYVEALRSLELLHSLHSPQAPRAPIPLTVVRAGTLERGASVYRFLPGAGVRLRVEVAFRSPVGEEAAEWHGDADDFEARIAPARTFGWADEYAALRASGRAAGVDLESVIVFDGDGVMPGCAPPAPTEVARHKLLDLVGDLALHGGPPRGAIEATAPGHAATHAIVAEALREGVLSRAPDPAL